MSNLKIKICGLSKPESIDAAIDAGASHIGLVHFAKSPRHLTIANAAKLREYTGNRARVVLLLSNADVSVTGEAVAHIKPDIVQFHGSETAQWVGLVREKTGVEVWKAHGIRDAGSLERANEFVGNVDRLLFDAPAKELPGGNGETFRWDLLSGHKHQLPWVLAGGLTSRNVAEAIRATGADFVDTSSGVEGEPGIKDIDKIKAFCEAARSV